jgi:uncharacterized membrane protein YsdA (DUF1294 family)
MRSFVIVLAAWNAFVFGVYAWDKAAAKRGASRIRESTLIFLAFAFGAVGAILAMRLLRHKTRKLGFTLLVPLALFTSTAVMFFVLR